MYSIPYGMKAVRPFLIAFIFALSGCEPELDCETDFTSRIPRDTLFIGSWEYVYTVVKYPLTSDPYSNFAVDTIFIGETISFMPDGHPVGRISISASTVFMCEVPGHSGFSCRLRWFATETQYYPIVGDSIVSLNVGYFVNSDPHNVFKSISIANTLGFDNIIFSAQSPFENYALAERDWPNAVTLDYYKRVVE
jgi:hypothetical protein